MVVEVDFSLPVGLNWRFNQNVHVRARRNSPIFLNSLILVFIFINIYSITEQLSQRIKENRSSVEMHENKLFDAQIDKGKKKKKRMTPAKFTCANIYMELRGIEYVIKENWLRKNADVVDYWVEKIHRELCKQMMPLDGE